MARGDDIMGTMNMDGMGWMAGGMGLIALLALIVLLLAIAALVKYLFFGDRRRGNRVE